MEVGAQRTTAQPDDSQSVTEAQMITAQPGDSVTAQLQIEKRAKVDACIQVMYELQPEATRLYLWLQQNNATAR